MSAGELVGLAIFVGVAAGVGAAMLVPLWVAKLRRSLAHHEGRLDACRRWLDARSAMSQASKEFVSSFRALNDGAELDESLKRAETAREVWLKASREWSQATTQFLAWWNHPDLGATLRRLEQPDGQAVRAAIGKSDADVAQLFARLDELDAEAIAIARRLLHESPSWWWVRVDGAGSFVRRLVTYWSQPG